MFKNVFCKNFLYFLICSLSFFVYLVFFVNSGVKMSLLSYCPVLGGLVIFLLSILFFWLWQFVPCLRFVAGKELPIISICSILLYFSWMEIEKKELGVAFIVFFSGCFVGWGGWKWLSNLEEKIYLKHQKKKEF
ncbi:MAG: hypothetical protein KDK96_07915 [Chlamydiia bacterium]|nr:hypothetical protein [Chlamydiia bacterium]